MQSPTPDELRLARDVQERTFPKKIPRVPGFELFGRNSPAGWGSGDFFDAIGVKPRAGGKGFLLDSRDEVDQIVLTIGDATGHGMASALMATELRSMLRASLRLGVYHRDLVEAINAQLVEDLADDHFITLLMGRLNRENFCFRWVSFGQFPVWFYRASTRSIENLDIHHPPLGILPSVETYQPTETFFEPGDALLALTDGFHETMNPQGELLGEASLTELFLKNAGTAATEVYRRLWDHAESHAQGLPQRDDRTCLLIRRAGE